MKWRALGVAMVAVGLVLCLTGCVVQGPVDLSDGSAGNDTPVEDRQYLDDYYAAVVPAILEYLHVTNETLGTDWKRSGSEGMFRVSECHEVDDDEREQYRMTSDVLVGNPASVEEVIAAGDEMFLALGFTRSLSQEKEGGFMWIGRIGGTVVI